MRTKVKKKNEVMRCQVKVQRISKVSMKGKHTDIKRKARGLKKKVKGVRYHDSKVNEGEP